jgi:hypothetical protein
MPSVQRDLGTAAPAKKRPVSGRGLLPPLARGKWLGLLTGRDRGGPCFHHAARAPRIYQGERTMLVTILIILLILMLIGSFPAYPYSRDWGYGPSGLLGLVLIVLVILLALGRL